MSVSDRNPDPQPASRRGQRPRRRIRAVRRTGPARRWRALSSLAVAFVIAASVPLFSAPAPAAAAVDIDVPFADPMFLRVWDRADATVASGETVRSWLWGPEPIGVSRDYYVESSAPEHLRLLQYFDKARMEITMPDGDTGSPWFVTNGLLVKELVSGDRQYGDASFIDGSPAPMPVAGDFGDPNNLQFLHFEPHVTLDGVSNQAPDRTGQTINASLFPNQPPGDAAGYPAVTYGAYEPALGHNIASVFWNWMHDPANGILTYGSWVYPMGYPISEPYWTTATVGGTPTQVLVQLFERRVLTYTPSNPANWRVEMGNVGAAYLAWFDTPNVQRAMYSATDPHEIIIGAKPHGTSDIYRIRDDGSGLTHVANSAYDEEPVQVLPSGAIIYRRYDGGGASHWHGQHPDDATQLPWEWPLLSPDGMRVAYRCAGICVLNPAGGLVVPLDNSSDAAGNVFISDWRWSPDGRYLAFRSRANAAHAAAILYIADTFTGEAWQVGADDLYTHEHTYVAPRSWSPDGETLLLYINGEVAGEQVETVALVEVADPATTFSIGVKAAVDGAFSPTVEHLLVITREDAEGDESLWTVHTDGSDLTQRTDGPEHSQPSWNSDGTRILFRDDSVPGGAFRVVNADGSDEHEVFRP